MNSFKRQTLSLCMIVKNEEKFLDECLKSVRNVVDQMVIVDTGSSDRTIEIARNYGAEVYKYQWRDDFAAARNESIKYAAGDWILWMDADERLKPDSIPELQKLLRKEEKPVAYVIQIWNRINQGKNYRLSGAHRLFTNHFGITFQGRIHEQIVYSLAALKGKEHSCTVGLEHLGYDLDETAQDKKHIRNLKLLQRLIKDEPGNAYAHFSLGQEYAIGKDWEKAVKHFNIARKKNNFEIGMQAALLNTLGEALMNLNRTDEAEKASHLSIRKVRRQVGAYYLLYRIAAKKKNDLLTLDRLETLFSMNEEVAEHGKRLSSDVVIDPDMIISEIIKIGQRLDQPEIIVRWFHRFSTEKREQRPNQLIFLHHLLKSGKIKEAEQVIEQSDYSGEAEFLDLAGFIYIKQRKFEKAIEAYRHLLVFKPENPTLIKRLAGLYAKTGDLEKAQMLLTQLVSPAT